MAQDGANDELEKRGPRVHQLYNRTLALSHAQFAGVHAMGLDGYKGLRRKVLIHIKSTKRSFLTSRITIESEDHFAAMGLPIT